MWAAFEQLHVAQDIHGAQLAEIVESTRRYANELAYQRVSIDRQEVMLSQLRVHNCKTLLQRVLVYGGPGNNGLRPSLYRLCLSC
ncbi:hypothetical protein M9H77_35188 [Catharanthus roseus]|uniref:Uncharacterized protein n=1 Tax=Catharanthus roseus TaxID=4058 RepID=A0ACB9ZP11_CATRO|nr:hypothetical protein M9H77_35188 [Catharanthus roseus]